MSGNAIESPYKGSGSITREQFLFYEMRTTAKLMVEGLEDKEILEKFRSHIYRNAKKQEIKRSPVSSSIHSLVENKDELTINKGSVCNNNKDSGYANN